jgi:hypothetical protein
MEDYEIYQNSILIAMVNPNEVCLKGPLVIMGTYSLLKFLEKEMKDPMKFNYAPRTLTENDFLFNLCGRDEVFKKIAKIFSFIEKEDWVSWSHFQKVPVCTGMPGLGKKGCWKNGKEFLIRLQLVPAGSES